jgi:hypothetical protein
MLSSIRHRWTGRYEAHLWDKNCWNESQNKKGRQGNLIGFLFLFSILIYECLMKLANVLIFFHVAFQNYGGDLYNELLQCTLVRTYAYYNNETKRINLSK